jgi:ABC-2 type transport system permease protein
MTMLRVELVKHLLRWRSLVIVAALAAVPLIAGLATASEAGKANGRQGGLYGAAPFSALNHAAATLAFTAPVLLAVVVALLGSVLGAADRDWGTLRYLYVQPVSRLRLVTGKWTALAVCCLLVTASLLVAAVLIGLAFFGWHPFHLIGAPSLPAAAAAGRLLEAAGYVTACMLSIGSVALALGLVLPRAAEALAVSVALVVVATGLDGQPFMHGWSAVLPVHYWQRWTQLLTSSHSSLLNGLAVQAATVVIAMAAAGAILARRDPAA